MKDIDDLQDSLASTAGAMGKWPYKTVEWHCRLIRENKVDHGALDGLYAHNIDQLEELEDRAIEYGLDTHDLQQRRMALSNATVQEIQEAIENAYFSIYEDTDGLKPNHECPYEETGMDKSCWACPLGGTVLDELVAKNQEIPNE